MSRPEILAQHIAALKDEIERLRRVSAKMAADNGALRIALNASLARRRHENTWNDEWAYATDDEPFRHYHIIREGLVVEEDAALDAVLLSEDSKEEQ